MFGLGMGELILILLLALLLFGAGRLPEIGTALGKTLKNFKKELNELESTSKSRDDKSSDKK